VSAGDREGTDEYNATMAEAKAVRRMRYMAQ
jgi:hypothetical protein